MPEILSPASPSKSRATQIGLVLAGLGVVLLAIGVYLGLFVSPPDAHMGNVVRILYVHVPTAVSTLGTFTVAFVAALGFLWRPSWKFDGVLEASLEVGVLLALMTCAQGSIWARPTWGVWWDWDPRLTTTAVMLFSFGGVLALRYFVDDPVRRAMWSAVATIVAYADVPVVHFSVRWWSSLHQKQLTGTSLPGPLKTPLMLTFPGMLLLVSGFVVLRAKLAMRRRATELAPPPAAEPNPVAPTPEAVEGGR